jgi:hypothetical protein
MSMTTLIDAEADREAVLVSARGRIRDLFRSRAGTGDLLIWDLTPYLQSVAQSAGNDLDADGAVQIVTEAAEEAGLTIEAGELNLASVRAAEALANFAPQDGNDAEWSAAAFLVADAVGGHHASADEALRNICMAVDATEAGKLLDVDMIVEAALAVGHRSNLTEGALMSVEREMRTVRRERDRREFDAMIARIEARGLPLPTELAGLAFTKTANLRPDIAAADFVGFEPAILEAQPPLFPAAETGPVDTGEPPIIEFDLENEPGLFGDLARWSQTSAFRPIRSFAPLAALATLAPVYGRRYATPTGLGVNLYMFGLAETGAGKEALLGAPQRALDAADLGHLLGKSDFTSDSAFEVALRRQPNFVSPIDEAGEFLGSIQYKGAPSWARTVRKALLDLFEKGAPGARWAGKQRADPASADLSPLYSPTLTLLGCTTVIGFYAGLTEANLADGFMNRIVVVRSSRPGPANIDAARLVVPGPIIDGLKAAVASQDGNLRANNSRIADKRVELDVVPWGPGAKAAWWDIFDWQVVQEDAGRGGVTNRAAANALRIATIRALARDPKCPAVSVEDIGIGWGLVRASIAEIERGVDQNMAGSEFETALKLIERAICEAGPEGITQSVLKRRKGISKYDDRTIDGAIKRLVETESIYQPSVRSAGAGRPSMRYVARPRDE